MRTTFLAVIASVVAADTVAAAELPYFDVYAWCAHVSESVGGSEMIRSGCLEQEQIAYDKVQAIWPRLPESVRAWCIKVADLNRSYLILSGCVDVELQAIEKNREFRFRR